MWFPTPTVAIQKEAYLKYYPIDKNESKKLVIEKNSGDIETLIAINEKLPLFFVKRPLLKYRQHQGQESRNVNQSDPMIKIFDHIAGRPDYFSNSTIHKTLIIKEKYLIQKMFFQKNSVYSSKNNQ